MNAPSREPSPSRSAKKKKEGAGKQSQEGGLSSNPPIQPITRKNSAKFRRRPIATSEPRHVTSPTSSSPPPLADPPPTPPKRSTRTKTPLPQPTPTTVSEKFEQGKPGKPEKANLSLKRKTSAKFRRPPINPAILQVAVEDSSPIASVENRNLVLGVGSTESNEEDQVVTNSSVAGSLVPETEVHAELSRESTLKSSAEVKVHHQIPQLNVIQARPILFPPRPAIAVVQNVPVKTNQSSEPASKLESKSNSKQISSPEPLQATLSVLETASTSVTGPVTESVQELAHEPVIEALPKTSPEPSPEPLPGSLPQPPSEFIPEAAPEQQHLPEETPNPPALPTFPELPVLTPLARPPPPPPAIPRFSSPAKRPEILPAGSIAPVQVETASTPVLEPPFPLLPPTLPHKTRPAPPSPAIPRFPSSSSSAKHSVPTPPASVSSSDLSDSLPPPVPRKEFVPTPPVSVVSHEPHTKLPSIYPSSAEMAAATSSNAAPSESVQTTETLASPTPSYTFTPPTLLAEWDPSRDENIFSSTHAITRPVTSRSGSRQASIHGSIVSNSSFGEAPSQNGSVDRRLFQDTQPMRKHQRTSSNTSSPHMPSPIPSPNPRPRSAGSASSGSDFPLPVFDHTHLKPGNAAALLSYAETLELYRQNAKKAVDNPAIQYEFAIFMLDAARDPTVDLGSPQKPGKRKEILKEGLSILRRLADRGYPQAQYYLADCYSNGIGCKNNQPDLEKAFPLFVLAAKHGHIEANFRTALAYENAWGCRRDPLKAVQFLKCTFIIFISNC